MRDDASWCRDLSATSIRGRLAVGVTTLELAAATLGFTNRALNELITGIWSFIGSERLDGQEDLLGDLKERAEVELEPLTDDKSYVLHWTAWTKHGNQTGHRVVVLGELLGRMAYRVVDIGVRNLNAGVDSELSLTPALDVLRTAADNGLPVPELSIFRRSSFSDDGRWGAPHTRTLYES